ncbi:formylglycine-generating enzyme family protein [Tsukamurella spumae]|uniref:Formylglycine-generating enzyme family protein n=1 Tax=Tsukamurella spumae TaxID=44753 RepID=A0A846WVY7_9ACTN|nr:formylglycine-generating enzyme family protein [Tsukamurella spumae]NKY17183.1 formylglycine-generating enzyme family protein [Tsukamurella spumae]
MSEVVDQARIPAQAFAMGDGARDSCGRDGETPVHPVWLSDFRIDATAVTNAAFAAFVTATGYRTDAERAGSSAVFHLMVEADDADVLGAPPGLGWWRAVAGADWCHPRGPRSTVDGLAEHPVVQVSWNDAQAYCEWADRCLPTEAQWEAAARGGLPGRRFPWGDELSDDVLQLNVFRGEFPDGPADDGGPGTVPVRSYRPNGYGVWQAVGNVWEWCADVFSADTYARDLASGLVVDPTGPDDGDEDVRVLRGGSYLCHDSYCRRYRNSARTCNTRDSSAGNIGFRTVSRPAPAVDGNRA